MSLRSSVLLASFSACLATLAASCGGDDGGAAPDAGYDCSIEDRDDVFVAGLEKVGEGGALRFRLMSSTPAPPSRGDNDWVIEIVDGSGATVEGATVTAKPFMPDHRHNSGVKAVVTETGQGRYDVTPVNLWMPGLWEVTLEARPPSGPSDKVVFRFCVSA